MLNRTRNEVLNMLQMKLNNDLNYLTTECGDFTDMNDGKYYNADGTIATPPEAAGWSPGMKEFVRRVAIATAISIVDAIYTEEEMNAKVDGILLTDEDQ